MHTNKHHPTFKSAKNQFSQDFRNAKEKTCEACGAISDTAQHARANAHDVVRASIDDIRNSQESLVKYVKQNPVKSVGLALLAGLIAAKLL
jgi:ElaB/YqjD/DUF883 family membrane-anchored ribosome-binding protein